MWVWPNTSTSPRLGGGEALVEPGGLVLEEVLVDLARRAVHEMDAPFADLEAQVERQLAHEVLRRLVGVRERPGDRLLTELAVVRGDVRAAAVLEVARDRVVVVAVDGRDLALGDQRAHLVRVRPVADEVAAAVDPLDAELVDARERGLQRGQIAVDVGDHRDAVAVTGSPSLRPQPVAELRCVWMNTQPGAAWLELQAHLAHVDVHVAPAVGWPQTSGPIATAELSSPARPRPGLTLGRPRRWRRCRGSLPSALVGRRRRAARTARRAAAHDPARDVVADATHPVEVGVGGVVELPVLVALAGVDRARVAAAHGDHDVGGLDEVVGQRLRELLARGRGRARPSR